jgi:hypothetical protein
MALTAGTSAERARQLIALTQRLSQRLQRETAILEAHRPQDLYEGIEETRQLSNMYRHESARIKADPSLLAGLTPAERTALLAATEAFQGHLRRYEIAVNAAKTITEGIVKAVAEDMNRRRALNATYGPRARTLSPGPQSLNYGYRA